MSIPQWALESGIKAVLKDAEKDGKVNEFVNLAESHIQAFYPSSAAEVKKLLVKHIIFPFGKLLLKNDPAGLEECKKNAGL